MDEKNHISIPEIKASVSLGKKSTQERFFTFTFKTYRFISKTFIFL